MRCQLAVGAIAFIAAVFLTPTIAQQTPGSDTHGTDSEPVTQELMQREAGDIKGLDVVSAQGERLGSVNRMSRRKTDRTVVAVVSTGGFLGIGAKQVVVPVEALSVQNGGESLLVAGVMTEDELKQMDPYSEEEYEPIDSGTRISAAVETGPGGERPRRTANQNAPSQPSAQAQDQPGGTRLSFDALDTDRNGSLSRDEARRLRGLDQQWSSVDEDRNGKLDRSEFAAFQPDTGNAGTQQGAASGGPDVQSPRGASGESPRKRVIEASFWDIDANQDGAIGPDEAQGHWELVERWSELDKNGDGEIDRSEFAAFEAGAPAGEQQSRPLQDKRIEGTPEIPPQEQLHIPEQK